MFNLNGQKKIVSWNVQVQISRYQEIKTIHVQVDPYLDVLKVPGTHMPRPLRCTQYLENWDYWDPTSLHFVPFMSVSFHKARLFDHRNSPYSWFKASSECVCIYPIWLLLLPPRNMYHSIMCWKPTGSPASWLCHAVNLEFTATR